LWIHGNKKREKRAVRQKREYPNQLARIADPIKYREILKKNPEKISPHLDPKKCIGKASIPPFPSQHINSTHFSADVLLPCIRWWGDTVTQPAMPVFATFA
jgi:hypothetical protein